MFTTDLILGIIKKNIQKPIDYETREANAQKCQLISCQLSCHFLLTVFSVFSPPAFPPHLPCICFVSTALFPVFFPAQEVCTSLSSPVFLHLSSPAPHRLVSLVCIDFQSICCIPLHKEKRPLTRKSAMEWSSSREFQVRTSDNHEPGINDISTHHHSNMHTLWTIIFYLFHQVYFILCVWAWGGNTLLM